ncbi:hypothetical protein TSOC_008385, partial [Tetrabaena socialis]
VRVLEDLNPVDIEATAGQAIEGLKDEDWELGAMKKRQAEADEEAEASDEDKLVEDWDREAANEAYSEYAVLVEEHLKEAEAAEAAQLAAREAELARLAAVAVANGGILPAWEASAAAAVGLPVGPDGAPASGGKPGPKKRGGKPSAGKKQEAAAAEASAAVGVTSGYNGGHAHGGFSSAGGLRKRKASVPVGGYAEDSADDSFAEEDEDTPAKRPKVAPMPMTAFT